MHFFSQDWHSSHGCRTQQWPSFYSCFAPSWAAASFADSRDPPFCGNPFPLTSNNLDVFKGIANGSINAEQGSSDLLSMQNYGGPREWPRNGENKVVIQYCFETHHVRDKVGEPFYDFGIDEWMRALGGAASSSTGYGLVFEETVDESDLPLFCKNPEDVQWDAKIDYNAVMVKWSDTKSISGASTVGFIGFPLLPGIHEMTFGYYWNNLTLVHELGHLMGMAHEHQRKDRDSSIAYRCHNVRDFHTTFEKFKAEKPDATWSDLCDDIIAALRMDFAGKDFVRGFSAGDPRIRDGWVLTWEVADYGEPYDQKSIMHYDSTMFVAGGLDCLPRLTDGCTLVNNLPEQEKGYLRRNFHPSAQDVKWVKKTYSWMDPPNTVDIGGVNGTIS